jgi:putative alpha-1,2-mannosidase
MSAWYLFSAMGMYPVCPGEPMYVIGSPLFTRMELALPNGKTLRIVAESNDANNVYIQSAHWEGQPLNSSWISHQELSQGGELMFKMGPAPNVEWASSPEAAPFSLSRQQ